MFHAFVRFVVTASCLLLAATISPAQAPVAIPFEARLTSASGAPITNAAQPVILSLYSAASGGTAVYTESQTVAVSKGFFATTIGKGNPGGFAALNFNAPYWIGVKVGADPEMTPRYPLAAVPYADLARTVADGSVTNRGLAYDPLSLAKASGGALTSYNGSIGINTTTPGARLDVNGGVQIRGGNVLEFGAGIAGKEANAGKIGYGTFTVDTLDIVGAGSTAGARSIFFHAEGGAGFSGGVSVLGGMTVYHDQTIGGNQLIYGNQTIGGGQQIGGSVNVVGYLGVGNITPQGSLHVKGNGPVVLLEGADHAYIEYYPRGFYTGRKGYIGFPSAGSNTLEIANEDGGTVHVIGTFVNDSDARLKTNIAPLDGALGSVEKLRGVSFDWRKDLPGIKRTEQRQIGFLAQDVEKVLPDLVYTDADGHKSVAYVNVIPVLVEAIKEQQGEIAALKAEVDRLKR